MDISDLLTAAAKAAGVPSDLQLGKIIDVDSTKFSKWRKGHYQPGDDAVISLCKVSGISIEIGLLWAASWRAEGEAKTRWERMAKTAEKAEREEKRAA